MIINVVLEIDTGDSIGGGHETDLGNVLRYFNIRKQHPVGINGTRLQITSFSVQQVTENEIEE